MATSAPMGDSSVRPAWTPATPDKAAVEKQRAARAEKGKVSPGKIGGSYNAAKQVGNPAQAEKTAKVFESTMKAIGGWGLTGAAAASYLLKAPLLNMAIDRSSFISKFTSRSKNINSSKTIRFSNDPNEPNTVTKKEFKKFRSFTGQLVKPSDKLNKWSLNLIKEKNKTLYDQIKNKPTNKFSPAQQRAVDEYHFQGIKEHLELTAKIGNADSDPASHEIREAHVAEVLAKSLAYIENIDGREIKIPIRNENGEWEMKQYTVETKTIGDNLPIHVLKPTEPGGKTFVVIRGTELRTSRPGAAESTLADLDENGIAHSLVQKEMSRGGTLRQVFDEAGKDNVILVGHSLGGAIVNIAAIRDINSHGGVPEGSQPSHNIHKAYGFSAPGIGNAETELAKKAENKDEVKKRVVNYQTSGDVVPTVGNSAGTNKEVTRRGAIGFIKEALTNPIDTHFEMGLNQSATVITTNKFENDATWLPRKISGGALAGPRYGMFGKAEKEGATPSYYMKA